MIKYFYDLLDRLKIGIVLVDRQNRIIYWNKWMQNKTDLSMDKVLNVPIGEIFSKFNIPKYNNILSNIFDTGQARFLAGAIHGTFFSSSDYQSTSEIKQNIQIEKLDENTLLIQVEDLTGHYQKVKQMKKFIEHLEQENDDIRQMEEASRRIAIHDMLTTLPNRLNFINRLQAKLIDMSNSNSKNTLGIFFIDLDDLKKINDTYGHKAGDDILKEFAQRLIASSDSLDAIARLAGDEFVLFTESKNDINNFERQARLILKNISSPFYIEGNQSLNIQASIGISIYPNDALTVDDLLDKADKAINKAEDLGKDSTMLRTYRQALRDATITWVMPEGIL